MRHAVMSLVFAAVVLALSAGHAGAQIDPVYSGDQKPFDYSNHPDSGASCGDFVRYWLDATKRARLERCIPAGDQWTTVVKTQQDFCESAADYQRVVRTYDMFHVMLICETCSKYVDTQRILIASNILYRCGFGSPDAGRWSPYVSRESQINACLGDPSEDGKAFEVRMKSIGGMLPLIEACKLTHQPQGCLFSGCHSSNSSHSSSAVQAMPKSRNALHDLVRPRPDRPNPKGVNVIDPCKPGTRSFDPSSCKQPATKVMNSGAMERLQGGSPTGPPSGGRDQGASSSRPAATAAPSAPATPNAASPLYNRTR